MAYSIRKMMQFLLQPFVFLVLVFVSFHLAFARLHTLYIGFICVVVAATLLYFLPTIKSAFVSGGQNSKVEEFNALFGWTGIGWWRAYTLKKSTNSITAIGAPQGYLWLALTIGVLLTLLGLLVFSFAAYQFIYGGNDRQLLPLIFCASLLLLSIGSAFLYWRNRHKFACIKQGPHQALKIFLLFLGLVASISSLSFVMSYLLFLNKKYPGGVEDGIAMLVICWFPMYFSILLAKMACADLRRIHTSDRQI